MDNLLNCPICCNKLCQPVSLICGHTFCYQCMYRSLITVPRCPLCRSFVQVKPDFFKVNIILHSMISKFDKNSVVQEEEKKALSDQPSCIILYTKEDLFAYSFQRLLIMKIKDSNLTQNDYVECLNHAEVIISNEQQKINVISRLDSVQIINNDLIVYALNQYCVESIDKMLQGFVIESTDQFGNKDKKEIILPLSKCKLKKEDSQLSEAELIEMNEIKHRIVLTLEKIFNKNSLLDSIEQEVYQKLHQCWYLQYQISLFEYLQESDGKSLIKLSFCLTSMLQIPNKMKFFILAQPHVRRLKLAEQSLNKLAFFKHGGIIFLIPNDHPKPPFIQLILVIIFIIFYFIFIN